MKEQTKNKVRLYFYGVLTGVFITVMANYYLGRVFKKSEVVDFNNQFSEPKFEKSFSDTKEVAQYVITDYLGNKIVIRANNIKSYSFDEKDGWTVKEEEKVRVPVKNNDYLLDEYISEKEATVFKTLKNKDTIKNQFYIYLVFEWMEELYEEYLNRKSFDTLENRKEAVYKVCYDYVISDKGYTMGGYKFSELPKAIQKDILEVYQKINYMKKNGTIKEESKLNEFFDYEGKVLKYELFRIGR